MAQSVRALPSHGRGRRFKSCCAQTFKIIRRKTVKLYKALLILGLILFIVPLVIDITFLVSPDNYILTFVENTFPILKYFHTNSLSTKADVFVLFPAMLLAIIVTLAIYERGRILLIQTIFIKLIFDILITPLIILKSPDILSSNYILLLIPYFLWYLIILTATAVVVWIKRPFPREGFKGTIIGDIDYGIVESPEYFTDNIKEVYFRK